VGAGDLSAPLVDPLYAAGAANYFTSAFLDELPDSAVETFADAHQRSAGLPAACELATGSGALIGIRPLV
jgi:hypothetical protein